jgi:hypothetical protein
MKNGSESSGDNAEEESHETSDSDGPALKLLLMTVNRKNTQRFSELSDIDKFEDVSK